MSIKNNMLQFLAQTPESLLTSLNLDRVWLNNSEFIIDRLTVSLLLNYTKNIFIILESLDLGGLLKYLLRIKYKIIAIQASRLIQIF